MDRGIRQTEQGWEVVVDGATLGAHPTYQAALAQLAAAPAPVAPEVAAEGQPGVLADWWVSDPMVLNDLTRDGRDFTAATWEWRTPGEEYFPLMWQTETEMGHFGAELAGFAVGIAPGMDGQPMAYGRLYATDSGQTARDMLAAGPFGVSVDIEDADVTERCLEWDDEAGWCTSGQLVFGHTRLMGLTGTPFPAFSRCLVRLATADEAAAFVAGATPAPATVDGAAAEPLAAAGGPARPPAAWFAVPEPEAGSPLLVPQRDGSLAVPLTITEDGQVFGHLTYWGQCHIGYGGGQCVSAPPSQCSYAEFLTGSTVTADGTEVPTGALHFHCDHAPTSMALGQARDHYAHTALGAADLAIVDGQFGPWVCGALRPGLDDDTMRVLRGSTMSGDWRPIPGGGSGLELCAVQLVSTPGFGIRRIAASAGDGQPVVQEVAGATARLAASGAPTVLLTANLVSRGKGDCGCGGGVQAGGMVHVPADQWQQVVRTLAVLERRTRPLIRQAAADMAATLDAVG